MTMPTNMLPPPPPTMTTRPSRKRRRATLPFLLALLTIGSSSNNAARAHDSYLHSSRPFKTRPKERRRIIQGSLSGNSNNDSSDGNFYHNRPRMAGGGGGGVRRSHVKGYSQSQAKQSSGSPKSTTLKSKKQKSLTKNMVRHVRYACLATKYPGRPKHL